MLRREPSVHPSDDRVLRIYVSEHCDGCHQSRRLAREVAPRLARLGAEVELIDIDREQVRDDVFAVPTYVFQGRVVSLGNPSAEALVSRVIEARDASGRGKPLGRPRSWFVSLTAGAAGIVGTALCCGAMVGAAASTAATSFLPAWFGRTVTTPVFLTVSVLLVLIASRLGSRWSVGAALVGAATLYGGTYLQPREAVMYLSMAIGMTLLTAGYIGGVAKTPYRVHRAPPQHTTRR